LTVAAVNDASGDGGRLYDAYAAWKDWRGEFAVGERQARYYAAELDGIALEGRRVLEIGFGDGGFLAWAKAQGANISGTEIDADVVALARAKGFDAHPPALEALVAQGRQFDLVAAFDVLEHWDKAALVANLRQIAALLVPGGLLIARFPNGQSPFGRVHQHGDLTHQTALSATSIEQLAIMTGLELVRVGNAARVPARRDAWTVLKHRWRQFRRDRIEKAYGKLYFGSRLPLDPNLTARLRKPAAKPA